MALNKCPDCGETRGIDHRCPVTRLRCPLCKEKYRIKDGHDCPAKKTDAPYAPPAHMSEPPAGVVVTMAPTVVISPPNSSTTYQYRDVEKRRAYLREYQREYMKKYRAKKRQERAEISRDMKK